MFTVKCVSDEHLTHCLQFSQVNLRRKNLISVMALLLTTKASGFVLRSIGGRCRPSHSNIKLQPWASQKSLVSFRTFAQRSGKTLGPESEKEKNSDNDDSLDDLMGDVEMLLAEISSNKTSDTSVAQDWMTVDWSKTVIPRNTEQKVGITRKQELRLVTGKPSPVEAVFVRDRAVYIKRDDLLRLEGSHVSGNKARKMYALNQVPSSEFPDCVVSYGGPQSNAMLALAAIVHSKNAQIDTNIDTEGRETKKEVPADSTHRKKRFVYYSKKLPRFLKNQPNGNFFRALTLGMELVELSPKEYNDLFQSETGGRPEAPQGLPPPVPGSSLWIPQGGACGLAVPGGRMLAEEIVSFWSQQGQNRPLSILLPGGTCTTALLLHREIKTILASNEKYQPMDIRVVVIPCVGDDSYARRQMMALSGETGGASGDIPDVLSPIPDSPYAAGQSIRGKLGYFNFGEPDAAILETFREMKEDDVSLDLLYGAPAWTVLLRHWRTPPGSDEKKSLISGRELMYVHSGGLEGVVSQLMRYKYKGLVNDDEIQLPGRSQKQTKVENKPSRL